MWIAAIPICLLAASSVVAIVRSIPASYAGVPDEPAPSKHVAVASVPADAYSKDSQAELAGAQATIKHRHRASCSECGVIESIREIERPEVASRQHTLEINVAGRVSGGAIVASAAITGKSYEITVRFRDGSTTVFHGAGARTWRMGSRVIVIGRSIASN
jgi:hypothetical protein